MGLLSTARNVAAGRLPPATRFAVLCGCGLFIGCLLVFKPVAGGGAAAKPLTSGVALLPPGNALAESQSLLDPSAAYLPVSQAKEKVAAADVSQVEDSPLAGFDPILRFSPGRPVDLTLESEKATAPAAQVAIPLSEWEPFATLGSANLTQGGLTPRTLFFEIFALSGAEKPISKGKIGNIIIKKGQSGALDAKMPPILSYLELIIGVDSMGLQAPGVITRSSGDPRVDAAVVSWSAQVPWAKQLPPGSYRLVVGP